MCEEKHVFIGDQVHPLEEQTFDEVPQGMGNITESNSEYGG